MRWTRRSSGSKAEDEDSEWVYSLDAITLTEKPGGGGAVETVSKLAMPIAATDPPTQPLGNNPIPTHYQLLLPSGKTGWVDVNAVQSLAVDRALLRQGSGRRLENRRLRSDQLEHDPEKWEPVFGKDHAQENVRDTRRLKLKRSG